MTPNSNMAKILLLTTAFLLLHFGFGHSSGTTSISVLQVNGKTKISLDGKNIDLEKANIVQEDPYQLVLSPIEVPDAVITISKREHGKISVDHRGQHYETLRPEDITKQINANMAQMHRQMEEMTERMQNMGRAMQEEFELFPFMRGMRGFFQ